MLLHNNIFKFLSIFLFFFHLISFSLENKDSSTNKLENTAQIEENNKLSKKSEEEANKQKATKGYFGKSTSFYDKDGNPKILNKDFKSLTYEELNHNREIYKTKDAKDTLIRYTERMINLCKDSDKICKLRLELADLYFDVGNFDKSSAIYGEFIKMYPGNKNIENVAYKTILSKFKLILPSDKDQTQTREVIKLINEFVLNETYTGHKKEIIALIEECNKKLLGSELNIFNFYLKKPNLQAAEKRLAYIKDYFFKNPKSDQFILHELEKQLEAAKNKQSYTPKYTITTNSTIFENNVKVEKESNNKKGKKSYASRF